MDKLLEDRIEFDGDTGGMVLKRAIIGIRRAEKVDYGYPVPENKSTIVTIDGGQNHWVDHPVKTVMAWMRGEVASSDDRPCICERGKENPDCPHSAHKRSEVQK